MIRLLYSLTFLIFLGILSACTTMDNSQPRPAQHPLLDKIWSVADQRFITLAELEQQILKHDIILLGETHDNQQHHRLQANVIELLINNHQSPAVAFEMLNQNQQERINQFQQQHTDLKTITDDFAKAVKWEKTGWPEWSYYRPVFKQALENRRPVIATNLDIKQVRKVIKQGPETLAQNYRNLLKKYQYEPHIRAELEQDIQASHCDMLPEKMLSPMLTGQQVRDLAMMTALINALKQNKKLVMIAGSGHTRTDYGIPWYLSRELNKHPRSKILSLGLVEISTDKSVPKDYAQAWGKHLQKLPFDYVWFTSRAEREDQCEKMRAYMKKKKH